MEEKDCEKDALVQVNGSELTKSVLLVLSSVITSLIQHINTNECKSAELFAEDFFKQQKLKVRKKRGRPVAGKKDRSEQNLRRTDLFVKFWTKYPRKDGEVGALKWWLRIPSLELIFPEIMGALDWQIKQWDGGKFAPAPVKYILDKRWRDKPLAKTEKPNSAFKDLEFDFPQN